MTYFYVGSKDDDLPRYVWATSMVAARRLAEAELGPIKDSRFTGGIVNDRSEIDPDTDVLNEPEEERAARIAEAEES